ncbi:MAG: YceI family protein [Fibrella sp.]|nr:YceI family protein [Armatimonadota bacterium]
MKNKIVLIPIALVVGFGSYMALHPGLAYSEPRMISGKPTVFAQQQTRYTIDPAHASIYFEITHLGLSQTHGRINKFSGTILEDEKEPEKSSVEFTARIDSIDTGVPARDEHLRKADFFDTEKYPELSFKSKKVVKAKNGYVVIGDLTIKGKTKEISLPFKHYGPYTMKGMGEQPARVGVVAEPITIKRSDFGVGSTDKLPDGTVGVSDEVVVRISLEGTRDK